MEFDETMNDLLLNCPTCKKKPKYDRFKNKFQASEGRYTNRFYCCKLAGGHGNIFTAIAGWNNSVIHRFKKQLAEADGAH